MILSTLLTPPTAPAEAPEEAGSQRPVLPGVRERSRGYRRAVAVGLVLSVLVHILVIALSPLVIRYMEPAAAPPPPRPAQPRAEGTLVIDYRISERPPVSTREPEPEPQPEQPRPTPEREPAAEPTETEPAATAAERLRPRVGDWRLWVVPSITRRSEPTPAEKTDAVRDRLYSELEARNDSLAAEEARRAAEMDWTVGEEGNRWGLSPGKIHLGPLTLPVPINLGAHPAVQREQARDRAEYEAIQRQAGQGAVDKTIEERIKEIRERKEKEREEKADTASDG